MPARSKKKSAQYIDWETEENLQITHLFGYSSIFLSVTPTSTRYHLISAQYYHEVGAFHLLILSTNYWSCLIITVNTKQLGTLHPEVNRLVYNFH